MNIGIIGLGFMGGSLAKSLAVCKSVDKIIAFDKNIESLELAKQEKVIQEFTTQIDDSFRDLDIIFICTPVSFIKDIAKKLSKIVKKDCIITDIGSSKKTILEEVRDLNVEFIGAHPMVGSERSGYKTSVEYLFENSYYIITKSDKNDEQNIQKLKDLILEINAIPIIIEAGKHDFIVAVISHVPHIIASTLVQLVRNLDSESEEMKTLAAGGFKDITRIASSDPTMWQNISIENKEEIIPVIDKFIMLLNEYKNNIENSQIIYDFLLQAKLYRDSFKNKKINGNTIPQVDVQIKDESGAIAKIATLLGNNKISIKNIGITNNRESNEGVLRITLKDYKERDFAFEILEKYNYEVLKVD